MSIITTLNIFILILSDTNFLPEVSDFGISFLTIWQLNDLLSHFALQPSSGSHLYSGSSTQFCLVFFFFHYDFFVVAVICCLYCLKKQNNFISIIFFSFACLMFNCLFNVNAQLLALLRDYFFTLFGAITEN